MCPSEAVLKLTVSTGTKPTQKAAAWLSWSLAAWLPLSTHAYTNVFKNNLATAGVMNSTK